MNIREIVFPQKNRNREFYSAFIKALAIAFVTFTFYIHAAEYTPSMEELALVKKLAGGVIRQNNYAASKSSGTVQPKISAQPISTTVSGGEIADYETFSVGTAGATIQITWDMYDVPDELEVMVNGADIYDSGSVANQGGISLQIPATSSGTVTVVVNRNGGISGTAWTYTLTYVPVTKTGIGSVANIGTELPDPNKMWGEPVDTATGAHILERTLLKIHGAQELEFTLDYNSTAPFNDVVGMGWSHNFEAGLQSITNGAIQLNWNVKKSNVFSPTANTNVLTCSDLPVIHDTLVRNANGSFSLKEPSQRHWEFDSSGRLQQVVNAHGQAIQLYYTLTNTLPSKIQDVISGKSLYLAYNTNLNVVTNITDDLNRSVAFVYDSSLRLKQITKSDASKSLTWQFYYYTSSGQIAYEINPENVEVFYDNYDSAGRVSSQQDARGYSTYFYYDESQSNRIFTTIVDRTGATNNYVFDQRYLLLSATDPLGHTTSYGYDANGNRTSMTNALGQVQRFAYDSAGNMISTTDAAGKTTTSQFDSRNNLTNVVNAAANSAFFIYDANNNLTASVDFLTNQTTLAYDGNSQLSQTTSPRGGKTVFTHIGGLTSKITDAATNATGMAYDAVGRLIAVTNAAGFVSTNGYDLNDNLIATSDGLGNVWRYTYDSAGRKLMAVDPLNNTNQFYYNNNGDLYYSIDPYLNYSYYYYDYEQRLKEFDNPRGYASYMTYDVAGRLIATQQPWGNTNGFVYDAIGNLVATIDSLGVTNQLTTYDVRNQPIAIQDALGNTKRLSYDALQRLIQTVDGLNRTNGLAYDALSHLTTSTDPLALKSQQQFDTDGNRTGIINPRTAPYNFAYDLAGRLTSTTTASGKKTSYTLDGRNLVTNIFQPSGAQTVLTYDGAGRLVVSKDAAGTITNGYDTKGRLISISESGRTITRQYDVLDRLTNYVDAAGNVLQYTYDSVGNLKSLTYPDGKVVSYSYGANNWLNYVQDWNGYTTYYYYDGNGRVTNITHINSTITSRSYDAAGRLSQQLETETYYYPYTNFFTVNYGYDAAGQITGETTVPAIASFNPATANMTYDADNALISYYGQAVTNDANGNLTYGPLTNGFGAYTYDARNRLTGAGGTTFGYDPAGYRVAETNGGVATRYVVNPNAALSQVLMRVKNGVTNYYVYGLGLLYQVTTVNGTTTRLTYHYDYRGSTVALTDGNGNVTDRMAYSAYGDTTYRTGTNDTPFLFNGSYGVMTEANGLLNMRARFYNPTICRFLNPDPIGLAGGANVYSFAQFDPINNDDPFGLTPSVAQVQSTIAYQQKLIQQLDNENRESIKQIGLELGKPIADKLLGLIPGYDAGKLSVDTMQGVAKITSGEQDALVGLDDLRGVTAKAAETYLPAFAVAIQIGNGSIDGVQALNKVEAQLESITGNLQLIQKQSQYLQQNQNTLDGMFPQVMSQRLADYTGNGWGTSTPLEQYPTYPDNDATRMIDQMLNDQMISSKNCVK